MSYSIHEVAEKTGMPASTLRYYESEGLLPPVNREKSGRRAYDDQDLEWISIITCLKDTNMPITDIKRFVRLCGLGDSTLEDRRQIVLAHQKNMQQQLAEFMKHMEHINYKVAYYEAACKAGTEDELKKSPYGCSPLCES
jgi:DNA-binding transcriptional MerR regulator